MTIYIDAILYRSINHTLAICTNVYGDKLICNAKPVHAMYIYHINHQMHMCIVYNSKTRSMDVSSVGDLCNYFSSLAALSIID